MLVLIDTRTYFIAAKLTDFCKASGLKRIIEVIPPTIEGEFPHFQFSFRKKSSIVKKKTTNKLLKIVFLLKNKKVFCMFSIIAFFIVIK